MIRLAEVVRRYRNELLTEYGDRLLPSHYRALDAIEQCRTGAIGEATWSCDQCQRITYTPLSCGHRHCPTCQNHESTQWLQRQLDKQLPANYFLLTFTVPAELRDTIFRNQRESYALLFRCAIDTINGFALSTKRLSGQMGMSAVLHTHNRKLDFHPHIHILMPAIALNRTANTISQCKGNYLFNVKSVADVFRAKCLDAFTKTDITLPRGVPSQWNVHCKPVGRGSSTLKYLARYLYRGVISENQILSIDSGQIEYNFLSSSSGQYERRTLPAAQFLWKVLMHVLPLGFQRARCYGFLHHNARVILQRIQLLLHATIEIIEDISSERRMPCCKQCNARLRLHSIWRPPVNRNTVRGPRASPPVA